MDQVGGNAFSAQLGNNIDPLDLARASETAGEMSGDQAHNRSIRLRHVENSRLQCLSRMARAVQVTGNALSPVFLRTPGHRSEFRESGNVGQSGVPIADGSSRLRGFGSSILGKAGTH